MVVMYIFNLEFQTSSIDFPLFARKKKLASPLTPNNTGISQDSIHVLRELVLAGDDGRNNNVGTWSKIHI